MTSEAVGGGEVEGQETKSKSRGLRRALENDADMEAYKCNQQRRQAKSSAGRLAKGEVGFVTKQFTSASSMSMPISNADNHVIHMSKSKESSEVQRGS